MPTQTLTPISTAQLVEPLSQLIHAVVSEKSRTLAWNKLSAEQVAAYDEVSRDLLTASIVGIVDESTISDEEHTAYFHQINEGDYVVSYFHNRYGRISRYDEGFAHTAGKASCLEPLTWTEKGSNKVVAQESPQFSHTIKETVASNLPLGSLQVVRDATVIHHEADDIYTRNYAVLISGCQCQHTLHSWRGITHSGEVYQYATDAHMESFSTIDVDLRGMLNSAFSGVPLVRHTCLS